MESNSYTTIVYRDQMVLTKMDFKIRNSNFRKETV
ncbi:MAG: hypothetical protein ACI9JY_002333 [Saprospiraceae bacterium]|jgi:hypothetical protein